MTPLADVVNFAVTPENIFTWDAVPGANYYELRTGADWQTGTPLTGAEITGTSYKYSSAPLDAQQVFIKAKFVRNNTSRESVNAASVTTSPAPPLGAVTGFAFDENASLLSFDSVAGAASYEIRISKGSRDNYSGAQVFAVVSDNSPVAITIVDGVRYYIVARGAGGNKSASVSSLFIDFFKHACFIPGGDPTPPPLELGWLIGLQESASQGIKVYGFVSGQPVIGGEAGFNIGGLTPDNFFDTGETITGLFLKVADDESRYELSLGFNLPASFETVDFTVDGLTFTLAFQFLGSSGPVFSISGETGLPPEIITLRDYCIANLSQTVPVVFVGQSQPQPPVVDQFNYQAGENAEFFGFIQGEIGFFNDANGDPAVFPYGSRPEIKGLFVPKSDSQKGYLYSDQDLAQIDSDLIVDIDGVLSVFKFTEGTGLPGFDEYDHYSFESSDNLFGAGSFSNGSNIIKVFESNTKAKAFPVFFSDFVEFNDRSLTVGSSGSARGFTVPDISGIPAKGGISNRYFPTAGQDVEPVKISIYDVITSEPGGQNFIRISGPNLEQAPFNSQPQLNGLYPVNVLIATANSVPGLLRVGDSPSFPGISYEVIPPQSAFEDHRQVIISSTGSSIDFGLSPAPYHRGYFENVSGLPTINRDSGIDKRGEMWPQTVSSSDSNAGNQAFIDLFQFDSVPGGSGNDTRATLQLTRPKSITGDFNISIYEAADNVTSQKSINVKSFVASIDFEDDGQGGAYVTIIEGEQLFNKFVSLENKRLIFIYKRL